MTRLVGTVARGMRAPIIREGDDIAAIAEQVVLEAQKAGEFEIRDRDVLAMTEAIVARAQGNYATKKQIAADVANKMKSDEIGLVFPIMSRNRFAICLRGIAKAVKKIYLQMSYPGDEVGNPIIDMDIIDKTGIDIYSTVLTEAEFEEAFGRPKHPFTGMDYAAYYRQLIEEEDCELEIIYANDAKTMAKYADSVMACDIHTRERTKRRLREAGCSNVCGLDDILKESVDGSGFHEEYGLLGSNKATEGRVKLFPRNCKNLVDEIQRRLYDKTGRKVEIMVYGDGAFKDPQGKIWELADPVVSPGYTDGLEGTPNEIKLKYLADNEYSHLSGKELEEAIAEHIKNKKEDLTDSMEAQGTTPRKLTDLIGSLCDLTSGSGDKGTPIVYIQGYFDNFTK